MHVNMKTVMAIPVCVNDAMIFGHKRIISDRLQDGEAPRACVHCAPGLKPGAVPGLPC